MSADPRLVEAVRTLREAVAGVTQIAANPGMPRAVSEHLVQQVDHRLAQAGDLLDAIEVE